MRSILIALAYQFWPRLYKKRFFKRLKSLQTNHFTGEPELLLLPRLLKPDSVFIDVGANKGVYLYEAEKLITNGKIIGFEPNQKLVAFCTHLFKKSKIYPYAASEKAGNSILHIPKKGNTLQDTRASIEPIAGAVETINIQTIRLDEWVASQHLSRVDLVKIDVEGHEFQSLKGCEGLLKTLQPIFIIEIEWKRATYPVHELFHFIQKYGYEIFYLDRKSLQLIPCKIEQLADFQKDEYVNDFNRYINNFICKPAATRSSL